MIKEKRKKNIPVHIEGYCHVDKNFRDYILAQQWARNHVHVPQINTFPTIGSDRHDVFLIRPVYAKHLIAEYHEVEVDDAENAIVLKICCHTNNQLNSNWNTKILKDTAI